MAESKITITTREIQSLIYKLTSRAAPMVVDDKLELRKPRDELLLAASVIRAMLRHHNPHETLTLGDDRTNDAPIISRKVLGHVFLAVDEADRGALASFG